MSQDDLNLPNDVERLKALIVAERTRDSLALAERDEAIVHKDTVIASQHETIAQQQRTVEKLEQQLARLLRRQYGPQKERIDPDQLTLFTAWELEQLAEELRQPAAEADAGPSDSSGETGAPRKKKRNGHGRRPLPETLPREQVIHDLTDEERQCPCCGRLRKEIGSETSEQLEFVPASLKVIEHVRRKYACPDCEEHVAVADKPPQPIDRGLPGPGLLAYTLLSKYGDYSTLYRLEDILSCYGVILRRSPLCGWVAAAADLLQPLYDLMCDRVRQSHVIHTDDTSIKMLQPGCCRQCKFWTYIGDPQHPYAVYEFSLTREGKQPSGFLAGFTGYLQADAFSGYDRLFAAGRVKEVACMAHCRRYWWEAKGTDPRRSHEALSYIGRLYELEEQFAQADLQGDALRDARQQHAVPLLERFASWQQSQRPTVLPKSLIGQALTYTQNQWQALCRYTEDGALSIDNNLSERMMKLPALGRRNWLFVGSQAGGRRAAILLSMTASAKHCGVEPWAWLSTVLCELPQRTSPGPPNRQPDLTDLLPNVWLQSHPEHRWQIDDIRKEKRRSSREQKIHRRRKPR